MTIMKRILLASAFFALALLVGSCTKDAYYDYVEEHFLLCIKNLTDSDVLMYVPPRAEAPLFEQPLEKPAEIFPLFCRYDFYTVKAHQSTNLYVTERGTLSSIETYLPEDAVTFYFFDPEVLGPMDEMNDEKWAAIIDGEKWLARYTYTAQQVIDMDKVISFPS